MINISSLDTGECLGKINLFDYASNSDIDLRRKSQTKTVALTYDVKTNEIFTGDDDGNVFKWSNSSS